jgi:phosphoglucosamine mutase
LENVPVGDAAGLEDASAIRDSVLAAEEALGEGGRILVRASGTEPLVRVMVEAETEELARSHATAIAGAVAAAAAGRPPQESR